jgi:uncharacterized protein (TIGR02444 family)
MNEAAWAFCVREYALPGRAEALLRAQDEHGLDVVLQLFTDYLRQEQGVVLGDSELAEARLLVSGWRDQAVLPLRALRRALKEKPAPGAGGIEAGEAVRRLVLQAELAAERAELDALCDWARARLPGVQAA